jgi:hypothetical protein
VSGAGEEHYLFAGDGAVIGRLAFEQRHMSTDDLEAERQRATAWRRRQSLAIAAELGRTIGDELISRVTPPIAPAAP